MTIIGICGRSGSGKSTVGKIISKKYPAYIDCDKVSREIATPGSPCLSELCLSFGSDILSEDGSLNRGKLASIAFSSTEKTAILNRITHKFITRNIENKIHDFESRGEKFVFLDAPTLFESGINKKCNAIICVISNTANLLERITKRDNKTTEEAKKRLSVQHNDEFLINNSDFCIFNNGTLSQLESSVEEILIALENKYGN